MGFNAGLVAAAYFLTQVGFLMPASDYSCWRQKNKCLGAISLPLGAPHFAGAVGYFGNFFRPLGDLATFSDLWVIWQLFLVTNESAVFRQDVDLDGPDLD